MAKNETPLNLSDASRKTAATLRAAAQSDLLRNKSPLSLTEINSVIERVARIIPAGSTPGVILNGLARLPGRRAPIKTVRHDVDVLFEELNQTLDRALYGAVFAGPAAVIWGYQNLLKLAGKDPEDSFPEGTWQFYIDYALREDTARHTNETHGFDTILKQHDLCLSAVDRLTAWVMAAIQCLHQYPALLENEWRERVYTGLLTELTHDEPDADYYAHLYHQWELLRPYGCGADAAPHENYPAYRRTRFDQFFEQAIAHLRDDLRQTWVERVRAAKAHDLPAYQQQLSIAAYLDPGPYGEVRTPLPLAQTQIGVIYKGQYFLIPTCVPSTDAANTDQPAAVATVRAQVAALLAAPSGGGVPAELVSLVKIRRATLNQLRSKFNKNLNTDLDALHSAPVLLNCDQRPRALPLAELRQAERGLGSHALTVFDTGQTFAFDLSHIFFDGAWGAAFAEIMTNEALTWAVYLNSQTATTSDAVRPRKLSFPLKAEERHALRQAARVQPEANAETEAVNIKAMLALRKLFKHRSDLLQFTVNDLLVLYRAIHAVTYQPDPTHLDELKRLASETSTRTAALATLAALEGGAANPAILIPFDASQHNPRERLYPMSFEVPLAELDLLNLHAQTVRVLNDYETASGDRTARYQEFDTLQRTYLTTLGAVGVVFAQAKRLASQGQSASVGTIKLLAHLPTPLQRLLDTVPDRFDLLNDLIKGREVFSNVGAVVKTSTLTRFITAKDDNDKKTLAWGALTTADTVLHLTLRDFRPHVALLEAAGRKALANLLTQHYLDTYARGLNIFIRDLQRLTIASRETRAGRPAE